MAILTIDTDPFRDGSLELLAEFNNSAIDLVGNATFTGTEEYTEGKFSAALKGIGSERSFDFTTNQYDRTVSCYAKVNPGDTGQGVWRNGNSELQVGVSSVYFDMSGYGMGQAIEGLDATVWNHYVCTLKNNGSNYTARLYINGVKKLEYTSTNTPYVDNDFRITFQAGSTPSFASVDQMMVLNRELTNSEVIELYNMEEPSENPKGLNWNGNLLEAIYWNGNVTPLAQLYWNGIPILTTPVTEPLLTTAATHTGIHFPATSINKPIWDSTDWTDGTPTSNGHATLGFIHNKVVETIVYPSQTVKYSWYLNQTTLLFERGDDVLVTKTISELLGTTYNDTLTLIANETDCVTGVADTSGSQGTTVVYGRHMDGNVTGDNMLRIWYRSQVTDSLDPNKNTVIWDTPEDIPIAYTIFV